MSTYANVPVIIHADDYGETQNTCIEMIELVKNGHLDGISLITNMRDYERYVDLFMNAVPGMEKLPLINIHLNLVEGRLISQDTAGDEGLHDEPVTALTWMNLFCLSYHIPAHDRSGNRLNRRDTFNLLKNEIREQLKRGREFILEARRIADENGVAYDDTKIRIDSHQHAHMLPIVWKALMQVMAEDNIEVSYIRNAHELLTPFMKQKKCRNVTGIMKNRILALHAGKVERYLKKQGLTPNYLCGLMMSGHMDAVRLMTVLPDILKKCAKKGYGLEINIHPAMMLETEATEEIPMDSARSFYMSADRHMEALTARTIRAALENLINENTLNEEGMI